MITPARLLYDGAGRPTYAKRTVTVAGDCYVCGLDLDLTLGGASVEAVPFTVACPDTYTDHDSAAAPWATHVCLACAWALAGKPPDTIRMWSVVYREDRPAAPGGTSAPNCGTWAHLTNKGDSREIVDILLHPPASCPEGGRLAVGAVPLWFVTVADSGKIHILPQAPLNAGAGVWAVRFERVEVRSTPAEFATVLYHAASLLGAGLARDAVITGAPDPEQIVRVGLGFWRHHHEALTAYHGGALLRLAATLSTKDYHERYRDQARCVAGISGDAPEAGAGLDRRGRRRGDSGDRPGRDAVGDHEERRGEGLVVAGGCGAEHGRRHGGELAAVLHDHGDKAPDRDLHERERQLALDLG